MCYCIFYRILVTTCIVNIINNINIMKIFAKLIPKLMLNFIENIIKVIKHTLARIVLLYIPDEVQQMMNLSKTGISFCFFFLNLYITYTQCLFLIFCFLNHSFLHNTITLFFFIISFAFDYLKMRFEFRTGIHVRAIIVKQVCLRWEGIAEDHRLIVF